MKKKKTYSASLFNILYSHLCTNHQSTLQAMWSKETEGQDIAAWKQQVEKSNLPTDTSTGGQHNIEEQLFGELTLRSSSLVS